MTFRSRDILRTFLVDADKLWFKADFIVKKMTSTPEFRSPQIVLSFFQLVHSLKGTASMIPHAAPIVKSLHQLESVLACQSTVQSSQDQSWLHLAQESLKNVKKILDELHSHESQKAAEFPNLEPFLRTNEPRIQRDQKKEEWNFSHKGIFVHVHSLRNELKVWFQLSHVKQVLTGQEIAGRNVLCLNGNWVPVLGEHYPGTEKNSFGLALQFKLGQAVVLVYEVIGICNWAAASQMQAQDGLDLFQNRQNLPRSSLPLPSLALGKN